MNIHEYQAKRLLAKFGVAVPEGGVAYTPKEAESTARKLGGAVWVVKAQIHAGGRGKGGGVKVVKSLNDVRQAAKDMIGMRLVTHQTGPSGKEVKRVYVEQGCDIARELYLSMVVDRANGCITVMASTEGGVDIEEVAAKTPDLIIRVAIDPVTGMVVNIVDIKAAVEDVLEEFDHKHLNLDTPYFAGVIPTTENLAVVLWDLISSRLSHPRLEGQHLTRIRLYETDDIFVEYFGERVGDARP